MCARNNMRIAQPTTAAQYFHLLRSQVRRENATPLVIFAPKSMLRAKETRSLLTELENGSFQTVTCDFTGDEKAVTRLVLSTGKVGHEAEAHRVSIDASHIAIARVDQVYPWPEDAVTALLERFGNVTEVVWLQEEPENMGAWPFVHHQLHRSLRDSHQLRHVARAESASPATGSSLVHAAEQADLLRRAIG